MKYTLMILLLNIQTAFAAVPILTITAEECKQAAKAKYRGSV